MLSWYLLLLQENKEGTVSIPQMRSFRLERALPWGREAVAQSHA